MTLVVSEVFGPTWQGEGPSVGQRAGFVRLGRCNLDCGWCDTAYTWDWSRFDPAEELHHLSVDTILEQLDGMAIDFVVITGGEPLLQQRHLVPLLQAIRARGWRIEIETSGTIPPTTETVELVDRFNVSPKLANSGVSIDRRRKPDVLRTFHDTGKAVFKFVVCEPGDLDEIAELGVEPVYVMPEGTDADTITARMQRLAEPVLARGWNLTPRLHVLLWGDRRGV
jgi:7-carboxy-7-deazaguanine synthase